MKKNVGVILLVALFGSLLLNVCQFVGVGHTEKASPWVGTYICGDEWDGATYIVLTSEREYYRVSAVRNTGKGCLLCGCGWTGHPVGRQRGSPPLYRSAAVVCPGWAGGAV